MLLLCSECPLSTEGMGGEFFSQMGNLSQSPWFSAAKPAVPVSALHTSPGAPSTPKCHQTPPGPLTHIYNSEIQNAFISESSSVTLMTIKLVQTWTYLATGHLNWHDTIYPLYLLLMVCVFMVYRRHTNAFAYRILPQILVGMPLSQGLGKKRWGTQSRWMTA